MALLDLCWMVGCFYMLKKFSTCSSKFLNNFIKKAFVLNDGCNTIYVVLYNIQYVGRWALLNGVLKIRIFVKCVRISGRGGVLSLVDVIELLEF